MKKFVLFIICILSAFGLQSQNILGAWEMESMSKDGATLKSVVIFSDGYQVLSVYNAKTGEFIHTNGGTWKLEGDLMTEKVEFNSDDSERVGSESSFKIKVINNTLEIVGSDMKFTKIDNGAPGKLQGAWLMSGKIVDGKTQLRDTNKPRKTMKILSGTRFQWIAYDTETKKFMGTGGGTYTTANGDYTENIEFFSKDSSKVGLNLKFKYKLIDGNWYHSGLSSKGEPINEIWSLRK